MRNAIVAGVAAGLLVLITAACGTDSAPPAVATGAAAEPTPSGVATGPAALADSTPLGGNCAPLADVAPTGPLPAPGHMPAGSTMAKIEHQGYLVVGVDQTTDFFGYRDAQGNLVGFDDDVARQVANAIFGDRDPNDIRFVVITSVERIPDVRDGTVNLVADNMTITCDRLRQVAFSSDYYNAGQTILVPANSPVTAIGQLGGQRVCAAHATTSINEIGRQRPEPVPVSVQNWTDCLVLLQQGQVAAISTDNSVLAGLAAQDPDTKIIAQPFTCEPHGLAMSNAPGARDFVRFVNGVLEQMRTDGEWQRLYNQWVAPHLGPQAPPAPQYDVAVEQTCPWR